MKIAFISDLHVDSLPEPSQVIDCILERVLSIKPDVFIIAGDIASPTQLFVNTLHAFSSLPCEKILVAGNHDIWVESSSLEKGIHSGVKYSKILPQISRRNNFIFLKDTPYRINGVGFAGTIGWYDYTFRNKAFDTLFSLDTYSNKKYGDRFTWNDLKFAHWIEENQNRRKNDSLIAREMEDSLKNQIQLLSRKHIDTIVVITHHLPFQKMVFYPNRLPFDFFSAYMGSEGLGTVILNEPSVKYVICGHSHIKSTHRIGNLHAMKSPLGYPREWRTKDLKKLIEERLSCIEI